MLKLKQMWIVALCLFLCTQVGRADVISATIAKADAETGYDLALFEMELAALRAAAAGVANPFTIAIYQVGANKLEQAAEQLSWGHLRYEEGNWGEAEGYYMISQAYSMEAISYFVLVYP